MNSDTSAPKGTALVYTRVSSKAQKKNGSLVSQAEAERQLAQELGYEIGRVTIEAHSEMALWDRPLLHRDRGDLRAGKFAAFIVYSTDRLARDHIHLALIAGGCKRAGVAMHFVTETLNLNEDSDEALLLRFMKGVSSTREREMVRERSLRGKRQRMLDGKIHNMGPEKYGWRRDKEAGVRVAYEPEAAIIRRIFNLIANHHHSFYAVAKRLNGDQVPAPGAWRHPDRVVYWNSKTIMRIVRDPAYKGEAVDWQWQSEREAGHVVSVKKRPSAEHILLPSSVVPAIVTPELWARAQQVVAPQSGNRERQQTAYLLRNKIRCAVCGRKMWPSWRNRSGTNRSTGKIRTYRCASHNSPIGLCGSRTVNAHKIEGWVWEVVVIRCLQDPERINANLERWEAILDLVVLDDLAMAQREVSRCIRDQQHLRQQQVAINDRNVREILEREVNTLETEQATWANMVSKIEHRIARPLQCIEHLKSLSICDTDLSARYGSFDFDQKLLTLDALGVYIRADGQAWSLYDNIGLLDTVAPVA